MYPANSNNIAPIFRADRLDRSLPPQNIEAEEHVLGGILMSGASALARIKQILEPEAFFVGGHQKIYKEMLKLDRQNLPIDLGIIATQLRKKGKIFEEMGGVARLASLVDRVISDLNIDQYARIIQENYLKRKAIAIAERIIDQAHRKDANLSEIAEQISANFIEITGSPLVSGEAKSIKMHRCDQLLNKINHIQLNIDSPIYKEYLLQELAKESGRSTFQLDSLFYKSLIENEWEPTLSLEQLREKYGDQVREWLLHGLIPKGATTLLHALGGIGKTRLIYDFIYHLALGESWQGFAATKKAKILIIQTDEQPVDMLSALEIRGIKADDERFDIHYKTRWSIEHVPQLYREVERERYDLILIDSLASASRFGTISENDAEFAKPILFLNKIAADFNSAIMLIHHSSKAGDSRGSSAVFNAVSQVFQLTKDPNDHNPSSLDRILLIQKSRARRPAKYLLAFNPEDGSWRFDGEDRLSIDPNSPLKEQIVEFLSNHRGVKYGNQDLAEAINHNHHSVRRSLNEMGADGLISWKKQGKFKKYWIDQFESIVTKSQCDQGDHSFDHMGDQMVDQIPKPCSATDTESFDQVITKSDGFCDQNPTRNADHLITSSLTQSGQAKQNDHPFDHPSDQVDQLISSDQIAKGDRVTIADGCDVVPMQGKNWKAGTTLEILCIGKMGIYKNQLQVKKLGDNSCAAWIPIANVSLTNTKKN